jgi:hypothetical protein
MDKEPQQEPTIKPKHVMPVLNKKVLKLTGMMRVIPIDPITDECLPGEQQIVYLGSAGSTGISLDPDPATETQWPELQGLNKIMPFTLPNWRPATQEPAEQDFPIVTISTYGNVYTEANKFSYDKSIYYTHKWIPCLELGINLYEENPV